MHESFQSTKLQTHQFPSRTSGNATDKIDHNLHKSQEITCRFNKSLSKIFGVQNNFLEQKWKLTPIYGYDTY